MAPPVETWPASQLPERVLVDAHGKSRKKRIDLKECELLELLQYHCSVQNPADPKSPVTCIPVQRLFRRCSDRSGPFTVETTEWEQKQEVKGSKS